MFYLALTCIFEPFTEPWEYDLININAQSEFYKLGSPCFQNFGTESAFCLALSKIKCLMICFKVGENWQKTSSVKSEFSRTQVCCFCILVTWIDMCPSSSNRVVWFGITCFQSRFWSVECERNDSNVNLQRDQVDVILSSCFVPMICCDEVRARVCFCRDLVLFIVFS